MDMSGTTKAHKIDTMNTIMKCCSPGSEALLDGAILVSHLIELTYLTSFSSMFESGKDKTINVLLALIGKKCQELGLNNEQVLALTKHRKIGVGVPDTLKVLAQAICSKCYLDPERDPSHDWTGAFESGRDQPLLISSAAYDYLIGWTDTHIYNIKIDITTSNSEVKYTKNNGVFFIYKKATNVRLSVSGNSSIVSTKAKNTKIETHGKNAAIESYGEHAKIYSRGENAKIYSSGENAEISVFGNDTKVVVYTRSYDNAISDHPYMEAVFPKLHITTGKKVVIDYPLLAEMSEDINQMLCKKIIILDKDDSNMSTSDSGFAEAMQVITVIIGAQKYHYNSDQAKFVQESSDDNETKEDYNKVNEMRESFSSVDDKSRVALYLRPNSFEHTLAEIS